MIDRRAGPWLALLLLLLLGGLWPYLDLLSHVPWGPDAAKWVDRGTFDDPDWRTWVFSSKHFIGYRPLPALSFALNEWLTGYEPWGYRLTDLSLHLLVAAALFGVHRRLTGDQRAWGLLAVGVLLAHPATEEVVPYVARRSYLLQALASLLSISFTLQALDAHGPRRWAWWFATAAASGVAWLCNEGGFVVGCWLPFLVLTRAQGDWKGRVRALSGLVPTGLVGVAVLARRIEVLGSLTGGYGKHYFAFLRGHQILWRDMAEPDPLDIVGASITYALAPHGVTGGHLPGLRELATVTATSLVVGLLLLARRAPSDAPSGHRWTGPLLVVWMAGAVAIVAASGTWFWRQAYFLLPPLGLGVAELARAMPSAVRDRRWADVAVPAPVLVLLPLAMVTHGPLLRGMNESAHQARIEYGAHVHQVRALTADLHGPGTVFLAIPGKAGAVHNVRIWSNRFGTDRALKFKVLARRNNSSKAGLGALQLVDVSGRDRLVIDGKHIRWDAVRIDRVRLAGLRKLWLDRLHSRSQDRWLYVVPTDGEAELLPIRPPPEGASDARGRDRPQ